MARLDRLKRSLAANDEAETLGGRTEPTVPHAAAETVLEHKRLLLLKNRPQKMPGKVAEPFREDHRTPRVTQKLRGPSMPKRRVQNRSLEAIGAEKVFVGNI